MDGASMGPDDTTISAKRGELVANARQQRELWMVMNGMGGGTGKSLVLNQPVTIENNASDSVKADASVDDRRITLTINKVVNKEMASGTYSGSMKQAQNNMSGTRYY